jgi:DNA topoisomerase-1
MESAELERTTIEVAATEGGRRAELRATGSVVRFPGFLALYQEGRDDEEDEESRRLPATRAGEPAERRGITTEQHFTEPPPRFTEATLIKKLEELGIGRPSTYSATLSVLRDRGYVRLDKKRLVPEDKGRLVTTFLESFFERYVEYDFTADLEEKLDKISAGELDWREVLRDFWRDFSAAIGDIKDLRVSQVLDTLDSVLGPHIFPPRADGTDPRLCPTCGNGRLSLKLGKFGAFIGCSNYPECRYTRPFGVGGEQTENEGPKVLGTDAESGLEVTLRTGRFGPYVQLGEGEKPKRSSLPKGWDAAELDLEAALKLLSLPRTVGIHPESGQPILAGLGRFGPFVQHERTFANLGSIEDVFSVGINRAVDLIAEKASRGGGRAGAVAGRGLGDHPTLGGPVTVRPGRYGPYVNHGKVNATLPKGTDPETLTLEAAVALITAKAGDQPAKKPRAVKAKGGDGTAAKSPSKAAAKSAGKAAGTAAGKSAATAKKPAAKATAKATAKPVGDAAGAKPRRGAAG